MVKFFVESKETHKRWHLEIDADLTVLNELLESEDWLQGPYKVYSSKHDFVLRSNGYMVYGASDSELSKAIKDFEAWFGKQGYDTDIIARTCDDEVDESDEDKEEYELDVFDEMFSDDYF